MPASFVARGSQAKQVLTLLLVLYCAGRILQLFPSQVPSLLIVVLQVIPPAAFAFIHGKMTYRLQGALVFIALSLGVGTLFESLSLRTGFPFGHYYFTDLMGPKLFQLPILLALAYVGMGYVSWTVATLIVGPKRIEWSGGRIVLLPFIASFVMVAWDLSMDPVWANLDHAWVWKDGGSYFGVPISNFLGWYLTVYTVYQAFAFYLCGRTVLPMEPVHWRSCVFFYSASAAGNILLAIPSGLPVLITDPSGKQWASSGIIAGCVLVSIFVMGAFALIAFARLSDSSDDYLKAAQAAGCGPEAGK